MGDLEGMYVLMILIMGYREPSLAAPVFDDLKACVAAGTELEKRFRPIAGNRNIVWFCAPQSSERRRE